MGSSSNGANGATAKKPFNRLPKDVLPIHYDIYLRPNLIDLTFKGHVTVDLDVKNGTKTLVCNSADLKINAVKVNDVEVAGFELSEENETLTINLATNLAAGSKAKLVCDFVGELNDKMKGFYRSKYVHEGETRYAATTQFEATDARRCFPCWDEPALKATFSLNVSAPKNRVVLSNMPCIDETKDEEDPIAYRVCHFDKSPIMSTYLVAIIVGEFEACETKSKEGITVRVWTQVGKTEQGQFSLECSSRAITYYKDFFGVEYPLPKYDCIAIADFQMGAMENWGLVTFRESAVLVDPANTSANTKQWVTIVVTHEMAHQWFGNLVTMEWWTHLWLNEGFASFMQGMCTHALFPEFDFWTQFVADDLIPALELDALKNSHPIEVEVGHPQEIDEIFDNISYNKGSSVIRMLHNYIGDDAFRRGMKHYLTTHSYKNTQTEDLWASLEKASGKPVAKVMSTWTSQMGFPLVKVNSRVEGNKKILTLTQEKFTADGSTPDASYMWCVPIQIALSNGDVKEVLLEGPEMNVTLENVDWFKLNPSFYGYYRVQYLNKDDSSHLRKAIASKALGEVDRLSLIDDLFALVQAGKASTVEALELMKAFKDGETSYVVWSAILNSLGKLQVLLAHDETINLKFKDFVVDLLNNIAAHVGWTPKEDEHHVASLLRSKVLTRIGCYGHEATVTEAKRRFAEHFANKSLIPADLRGCVYRIVAANGGMESFQQLLTLFRKTDLQEEKNRLAMSMGDAKDLDILQKVLDFAMGDEVRNQDAPFVFRSVAYNVKGRELAWEFFKTNYPKFLKVFQGALLLRLCKFSTENFATQEKADEVQTFFKENENVGDRTIKQSVENIMLNANWLGRDADSMKKFFNNV